MKTPLFLLYIVLTIGCSRTAEQTKIELTPIPVSKFELSSPANILGSDFIGFISQLKTSYPGNIDTLLFYTSSLSLKQYSKVEIINWFSLSNLNFKKRLKAMQKIGDDYILSYECIINATQVLRTFTVQAEGKYYKLVPDVCNPIQ